MGFLKSLAKNMKRAAKALDESREVLDGAGTCLQSGADLARTAGAQVGDAVMLGQRLGRDAVEGVRQIANPARTVDVKVTSVKTNGPK